MSSPLDRELHERPRARTCRRRRRPERATAAVEYALIVAVLAVPTVGASDYLQDAMSEHVEAASAGIESSGVLDTTGTTATTTTTHEPGTTTSTAPPATTTTTAAPATTTTSPAATTSTAPPATTTTTAAPTTTTTSPPTTTTAVPQNASADFSEPKTYSHNRNRRWSASTALRVTDADGKPLVGAEVKVTIKYLNDNRWGREFWDKDTVKAITGEDGKVEITSKRVRRRGNTVVTQIDFVLKDVSLDGYEWDGWKATTSAS